MNASIERIDDAAPRAAPVHSTHKFRMLLRREFWEHKGGFFWTPIVAGAVSLLLSLMAIIVGLVAAHRGAGLGDTQFNGVNVNGMNIGQLASRMSPADIIKFGQGVDLTLFLSSLWPFIALAFVSFFYCLGALYDERKDRSVLFWKSLPVSDAQTVLSKVATAAVVGPLLAVIASVATMLVFMVMISIVITAYGGDAWALILSPSHPFSIIAASLVWIPVYALWALPTIGWLLLCSAWARTKPFLWATALPIVTGVFISWFNLMDVFQLNAGWFWRNVVGRLLLGVFPGMDRIYLASGAGAFGSADNLGSVLQQMSPGSQLASLASPSLWIGAAVGAAMIYAAILLRRRRELAD